MPFKHLTLLALPALLSCAGLLQAVTVSPLTANAAAVSMTYQKPSNANAAAVPVVHVTAVAPTYFTIDPASMPIWLNVDNMDGTANSTGASLNFSASAVSATLASGTYTASVKLKVTGSPDLSLPVTLTVKSAAATLSVRENTTQTLTWTQGAAYPTVTLNALSSSDPIAFTAAAASTANSPTPSGWLKIDKTSGVAYSWGTPITVTFLPQVFQQAHVEDVLTGSVTLTPASGSAVVVNFSITVASASATLTKMFPAETPVQANAQSSDPALQIVLTGTGFVASPAQDKTVVSVGSTPDVLDTTAVTVVNSTTMIIQLPATYLTSAGPFAISVANGSQTAASASLSVTSNPIIYSVVNSASYVEPSGAPTFAPYETISIFGANFGADPVTPTLATLDSYSRYPTQLTANSHNMQVSFYRADGTTLIANAYLLFATENQINALVPSGVVGQATVKIKVTYNSNSSTAFSANVGTADPGIFTTASSGVGQGAILLSDYSVNSATNRAAKSSTVLIYLTGLGAPNSTGLNTAGTSATYPAACISTAAYMSTMNAAPVSASPAWTTIDGAVVLSSHLAANKLPPCFTSTAGITVTIDGKPATVSYAGMVADSLTGLYQINAVVPSTSTSGTAIPVVVSVGAVASPTVTMAVQ